MRKPSDVTTRDNVGLGPYRLVKWDPGIAITAEAYPDYVPNPDVEEAQFPIIQNVKWVWRGEPTIRSAMIQAGEADLAYRLGLADKDSVPVFQSLAEEPPTLYCLIRFGIRCYRKRL
ncbi:MAG: hypothetical protein CM1200mP35_09530 [Chloroflexota bacterium]|nr:MAG: hypothetical protein CM1200mP35_09530 [Chloroflexota bacterium]